MILLDTAVGSKELLPYIRKRGVLCETTPLGFGDAAFEGKGPEGAISIGVERKALHDMLSCIEDSRYSAHQRVGMAKQYTKSFLIVEGEWRPHDSDGGLMEGFRGGTAWGPCRPGGQRVLYSKLYRYLISVALSGVIITYSRNMDHTAHNIVELFHYFQKRWEDHTSMLATQMLNIPSLNGKPPLIRRWAAELTGVGVKTSMDAQRLFRTPIKLATADEMDWLQIKGVGVPTAQKIVKEIHGLS